MGLIYLDACLLIYLVERHSRWGGNVARAIAAFGEERFGISPLVKCECLVGPIKRGDPVLRRGYDELFDRFVSLAMPEPVFLQAAELRGRFGLRTPRCLASSLAKVVLPGKLRCPRRKADATRDQVSPGASRIGPDWLSGQAPVRRW